MSYDTLRVSGPCDRQTLRRVLRANGSPGSVEVRWSVWLQLDEMAVGCAHDSTKRHAVVEGDEAGVLRNRQRKEV